jgi:Cu(I)/Ag(I) efflux system protein CusF
LKTYLWKITGRARDLSLTFALLPVLGMSMCDRERPTPPKASGPAAAVATTSYQAEGRVIATNAKFPSIEIDHQEIKGLMPAMTMEFYVKDKSLLEGLKAGDHIEFTIDNGVGGLVITKITKR